MDAVAAPRRLLQGLIPPEDDPEVAALLISCRSASGDGGVLLAQRHERMPLEIDKDAGRQRDGRPSAGLGGLSGPTLRSRPGLYSRPTAGPVPGRSRAIVARLAAQ